MQNAIVLKWSGRLAGALFILAFLAMPFAQAAQAETIITGEHAYVGPDEIIDDDLFISGQTVQIDGTVNGDVFAAGQEVVVNGTVNGNLFMAGQVLRYNGRVDGAIYAAGYSLAIGSESAITGNLYMAGFSLQTAGGSLVERSLYSAGYQAILNGDVGRDVLFSGGAFRLNGDVGRNLKVEINSSDGATDTPDFFMPGGVQMIEPGYQLGESATVGGEIDYQLVEVPSYDRPQLPRISPSIEIARARIGELVSLLIVGALMLALWPNATRRIEDQIRERPLQSFGWGLLLVIAFPVALLAAVFLVVVLAILGGLITLGELAGTILGFGFLGIGLGATLFGFAFWLVSKAVFGHLVGDQLFERISPRTLDSRWGAVLALLVGVVLYELVRAVPLVGPVVAVLVILIGFGAIAAVVWARRSAPRTTVVKRKATKSAK